MSVGGAAIAAAGRAEHRCVGDGGTAGRQKAETSAEGGRAAPGAGPAHTLLTIGCQRFLDQGRNKRRKKREKKKKILRFTPARRIKGIVHPFELGGETTLIRSAVKY